MKTTNLKPQKLKLITISLVLIGASLNQAAYAELGQKRGKGRVPDVEQKAPETNTGFFCTYFNLCWS